MMPHQNKTHKKEVMMMIERNKKYKIHKEQGTKSAQCFIEKNSTYKQTSM